MDLLSQHEAFLRAIFDAPDDDTPRLVYADFLQENGEEEHAAFIRWQCGRGEKPNQLPALFQVRAYRRGFQIPSPETTTVFPLEYFLKRDELRRDAVAGNPEWFGLERLRIGGGRITTVEPLDTLFGLAVFARLTDLDLSGNEVPDLANSGDGFAIYTLSPVITSAAVVALTLHRGLRRIERLNLTNNDLDNDAARALVKSPYLDNIKRLQLLEGNRFRGRVWQQVIERFGEDVVG
jgi:uncharacterized protein (TIGR02996 family)